MYVKNSCSNSFDILKYAQDAFQIKRAYAPISENTTLIYILLLFGSSLEWIH
jgi:hypothetical protein